MSTLKIQERFALEAAPELVWEYLVDPERTVRCLPGAELTEKEDDETYAGTVKVKVGAVSMSYRGKITFAERNDAARYVRMVGKGREKSGGGSATMTMEGRVLPLPDGGSEVLVDSEVRLTGRIVRFGRGMIQTISAEIFKEFRERLAETIRADLAAVAGDGPAEVVGADGADASDTPTPGTGDAPRGAARASAAGAQEEEEALRLLPILLRSFRSWLARLFRGGEARG